MSYDLDRDMERKYNIALTTRITIGVVALVAIVCAYWYLSEKQMIDAGYVQIAVPKVSSYEYKWIKPSVQPKLEPMESGVGK